MTTKQEQAYEKGEGKKPKMPVSQRVRWQAGKDDIETGMIAESDKGVDFVYWQELKGELENELLVQLGRVLGDQRCRVETAEFHGRRDWLINIVSKDGQTIGSVWLGGDPYSNWKWDGLVRVGNAPDEHTAKVWQIFERYSDGSYRRIEALDTPEDRIIAKKII